MDVADSGNVYVSLRTGGAGILKVNSDGTLGWLKHLGTIAEDPTDPLLLGDYSDYGLVARGVVVDANETTHAFVSAIYTPVSTNESVANQILVAIDSNGLIKNRVEPVVASTFPDGGAAMSDVVLTDSANLRMTGFFDNELSVAEFDLLGNEIWSLLRGQPGSIWYGFRAALTAEGSTVATGAVEPESIDPPEAADVHLTKISSDGVFEWEQIIDSSPTEGSTEIEDRSGQPVVDRDGDIFMVVTSFGGSIGSQPNQGGMDPLLLKLDGDTGEIIDSK